MELSIKIGWALLALLNLTPSLPAFLPGLVEKLYGVPPQGEIGVLLVHRGALFLTVFLVSVYAAVDPTSRKLASIILAVSMIGFLWVYFRAGMPAGDLRKIAIADLIGLLPLAWVSLDAWR